MLVHWTVHVVVHTLDLRDHNGSLQVILMNGYTGIEELLDCLAYRALVVVVVAVVNTYGNMTDFFLFTRYWKDEKM